MSNSTKTKRGQSRAKQGLEKVVSKIAELIDELVKNLEKQEKLVERQADSSEKQATATQEQVKAAKDQAWAAKISLVFSFAIVLFVIMTYVLQNMLVNIEIPYGYIKTYCPEFVNGSGVTNVTIANLGRSFGHFRLGIRAPSLKYSLYPYFENRSGRCCTDNIVLAGGQQETFTLNLRQTQDTPNFTLEFISMSLPDETPVERSLGDILGLVSSRGQSLDPSQAKVWTLNCSYESDDKLNRFVPRGQGDMGIVPLQSTGYESYTGCESINNCTG